LQRAIGALNPAFCLRCVGTDDVDVQFVQRSAELRHAVAADRTFLGDPEDAVLIAVKCNRLTMLLDVFCRRCEIRKRGLAFDELQMHQPACRVIDIYEQGAFRTAILEPVML
jgi:hypothetical protein